MRRLLSVAAVIVTTTGLAVGCGGGGPSKPTPAAAPPTCPKSFRAGWQRLANRIGAPVYCPRWMPAPLFGQIQGPVSFGGAGGSTLSIDPDRSYLATFVWAEPQTGEVHVNLRGYPGRTAIPICDKQDFNQGKIHTTKVPCFADPGGLVREHGIVARVYTANQDIDLWHILYAWHHKGGLYTISEHVARPLTYKKVVANLNRMLRNLVVVEPSSS